MTTDLGAIKASDLGKLVETIEPQRQIIIDAVDFLFQGFQITWLLDELLASSVAVDVQWFC